MTRLRMRNIEIDKYGRFEVYGDKQWIVVPVINPSGWIITSDSFNLTDTQFIDAFKKEDVAYKYNALIKITNKGARCPVVFTTARGLEMANEIAFILNEKLK